LEKDVAVFRYVGGKGVVPAVLAEPPEERAHERLRVNVVFTDLQSTGLALKKAVDLAIDLSAVTQVIVPHVVPYPLALDCPAVPLEFTCRQLQLLAASVGADPYIHIFLCPRRH